MNRRYLLSALLALPIVAGLASVAEVAMRPAKPAQMQPPAVIEVAPKAVTYQPMTAEQAEQERYARALYAQLNAEILSGRRAATKSGVAEREPIEGVDWWVVEGADHPAEPFAPELVSTAIEIIDEPPLDVAAIDTTEFIHHRIGGGYCCDDVRIVPREPVSVPEPSALPLIAAGVVALLLRRFWK